MNPDYVYLSLLREVLETGIVSANRTGIDTLSCFGKQLEFNLADGFPLLTTKRLPFKVIIGELLWLISGETNIRPLLKSGIHIWTEWPFRNYHQQRGDWDRVSQLRGTPEWGMIVRDFEDKVVTRDEFAAQWGDLGPVYGHQWRKYAGKNGQTIDQLQGAIDLIKKDPISRRIIVNSWNPADIPDMVISGLPPCHLYYQFLVQDGKLSTFLLMRSADMFLGVPFNIASYAALTHVVASLCNLEPGILTVAMVDCHIYENHIDQVRIQLGRKPFSPPVLDLTRQENIDHFVLENFVLIGYNSHPTIKGVVAI